MLDVGHVLIDWDPNLLYAKLIPDLTERERFVRDVVSLDWHYQHDLGRPFAATSAELRRASSRSGAYSATISPAIVPRAARPWNRSRQSS